MEDNIVIEDNKFKKIMKSIWSEIKFICKHPNTIYCLRRTGTAILSLFVVATVVFLLLRMVPKDGYYDQALMQKMISEVQKTNYIQQIDKRYGFDKPVIYQLFSFYWDILPIPRTYCLRDQYEDNTYTNIICSKSKVYVMYLGKSLIYYPSQTVVDLLKDRMSISFWMSIITTLLTYVTAYPLGVWMAKHKGKWQDKLGNGFIVLNYAIPGLVFYFIIWRVFMKWGFGGTWPGYIKPSYFIAPIFAMVFLGIPGSAMWVRRFMVDEGDADYVKFARSKGLSENRIMYTHVLRNAIVYLIRGLPAAFITAIVGSYYVEQVWAIPGTGQLLIKCLNASRPDNEVVQGLTIIYAALSMISFLLGDLITVFADPRIKLVKD